MHTSEVRIQTAFDTLREQWAATAEVWRDDVSRSFAENYLDPIGPTVKVALDATQRMAVVVDQATRECQEENEI